MVYVHTYKLLFNLHALVQFEIGRNLKDERDKGVNNR